MKSCDSLSFMQVVLIRHAHSEANAKGILSGRISGVHLSPAGMKQAQELSTRLGAIKVASNQSTGALYRNDFSLVGDCR